MEFGDAYAQSLSMTRFLMKRLGEEDFWALVYALDTMTFGEALQRYAGLAPREFWEAWRRSLWRIALVSSIVSGLTLFQVMAILTVMAFFRKRRRGKRILREWEDEDGGSLDWDTPLGDEPLLPWEMEDEEY